MVTAPPLPFRHGVAYAAAAGGVGGAVFGSVDVVAVSLCGQRIPWVLPPLLFVSYLIGGWLSGALVGSLWGWWSRSRSPARNRESAYAGIRFACVIVYAALCAAILCERWVYGWEDSFGQRVSGFAISILGLGIILGAGLTARYRGWVIRSAAYLWTVACLALFCLLWTPFSELYEAPILNPVSMLANTGYLIAAIIIYIAGIVATRRFARLIPFDSPGKCLKCTGVLMTTGLTLSLCTLWITMRKPIDLPDTRPGGQAGAVAESATDVIFIVMDTVRADHLSVYGYDRNTTPNLTAFTKEAVSYTHAVAPAPYTLSSHASMFTGLLPSEHGAHRHLRDPNINGGRAAYPLRDEATTLAEVLLAHGYDTAAVIGNTVLLDRAFGMQQGFLYYDDRSRRAIETATPGTMSPALWFCNLYHAVVGRSDRTWRSADQINESVYAWLDRERGKPFLLFVNYMDPHAPYRSHPQFEDQLSSRPVLQESALAGQVAFHPCSGPREAHPGVGAGTVVSEEDIALLFDDPPEGRPDLRAAQANYDSEIAFTDVHIGRLFDKLKTKGRYDSSFIIVTSDHGEAFGEHGHLQHSHSVYEEEIRVPFLVRYPGGQVRGRREGWVSLVEIMPIILTQLGIDSEPGMHSPQRQQGKPVIAEMHFAELRRDRNEQWVTRAVYTGDDFKVITVPTRDGGTEVYDLAHSPCETQNLVIGHEQLARWAEGWLKDWVAEAQAHGGTRLHGIALDDDTLRQLRSFGYID